MLSSGPSRRHAGPELSQAGIERRQAGGTLSALRREPSAGWSSAPPRHGRTAPAEMTHDPIEAASLDPLHGVVAEPADLSDVKDRHDMRVVQPGRGAGFVQEPPASR